MIVIICVSVISVALGLVILSGRGDTLIAGYNTASHEEKKKVNIKRLRLVVAGILFFTAVMIALPFLLGKDDSMIVHLVSSLSIVVIAITGVIIANTWCMK